MNYLFIKLGERPLISKPTCSELARIVVKGRNIMNNEETALALMDSVRKGEFEFESLCHFGFITADGEVVK